MAIKRQISAPVHGRRRFVIALSLGALAPVAWSRSNRVSKPQFAAAWNDEYGHRIGVLVQRTDKLLPTASIEVPTRAHGLLMEAGGSLLAVARRPGDWMVRWHPRRNEPHWVWAEPGRAFNGHVVSSRDGKRLYSTETDVETGQGLVGVWDARTLEKVDEWPTHGIDAHMMLIDCDTLLVANGGVPTQPETGRIKRNLHTMDSSLVRLDTKSGSLLGQWRLSDQRLSLRHLARSGRRVGIAMQAEHGTKAEREAAPVLAIFDEDKLIVPEAPSLPELAGYAGDIAAWNGGFAISAPRANAVLRWRPHEGWSPPLPVTEVCPLVYADELSFWAGGSMNVLGAKTDSHMLLDLPARLRLDNHWILV